MYLKPGRSLAYYALLGSLHFAHSFARSFTCFASELVGQLNFYVQFFKVFCKYFFFLQERGFWRAALTPASCVTSATPFEITRRAAERSASASAAELAPRRLSPSASPRGELFSTRIAWSEKAKWWEGFCFDVGFFFSFWIARFVVLFSFRNLHVFCFLYT